MVQQLKIVNVIIAQHQIHYYFDTVFAHVLFVHQPGANHAPRASVTQVTHSVHTLNTFLSIRADRSVSADLLGLCHSSSLWYFLDVFYQTLSLLALYQAHQKNNQPPVLIIYRALAILEYPAGAFAGRGGWKGGGGRGEVTVTFKTLALVSKHRG